MRYYLVLEVHQRLYQLPELAQFLPCLLRKAVPEGGANVPDDHVFLGVQYGLVLLRQLCKYSTSVKNQRSITTGVLIVILQGVSNIKSIVKT